MAAPRPPTRCSPGCALERSLLLFEDLHWADSDSVAVFEILASAPVPGLTLVATYRPDDLTSRLPGGAMLMRLERRVQVHQVHLDRLDRYEIGAFLAAVYGRNVGTAVVDALRNRTGGNPFFLEEILTAAGDVEPEALADQPLPWSLAEVVSQQLDGLSDVERRTVEAAAVLGARARFDVMAALSGQTENELIVQLRSLVERGLLVEEADDEFSFRHELVRDAVESQLLGRERRRLHEQALDVLRSSSSTDLADLARHAAGAGRYDEMVELAREGVAHYLGIGSTHQALRLAVAALAESPHDTELLTAAARSAWLIGAHDEAWTHAERLLAQTAGGRADRRSAAIRLAARIAHERSDRDRMWELVGELEEIHAMLPRGEERALAMAAVAQINMLNNRSVEAVDWAERAAEEADFVGAKGVRAQAMVERASALTDVPERRAEGITALIDAVEDAERVEDWVLVARTLNNLCNVVPSSERVIYLQRMREAGQRAGFDHIAAANYFLRRAELAVWQADAAAARHYVMRGGVYAESRIADWVTQLRLVLALEGNRAEELNELVATVDSRSTVLSDDGCPTLLPVMLAARRGDRVAALAAFNDMAEQPKMVKSHTGGDFLMAAESALAAGVPEEAVLAARDRIAFAQKSPELVPTLCAIVAASRSDHGEVIAQLDEIPSALDTDIPVPLLASAHVILARALASHRRTVDARQHATVARQLLERWPGWRREEADALLQRLEAASQQADGELTRREREVTALVAEGLTNSEIAKRLFISPKTAAVHVSNILMKLGIANRAEIAAWYVRSNVTGS